MNIAKELWWGFIFTVLFFVIVAFSLLASGYRLTVQQTPAQQPNMSKPTPTVVRRVTPTRIVATPTSVPTPVTLTSNQVAQHNNRSDCWIIINGSVYDVTNYLFVHPGGADQITPYCGADATSAYDSVRRHGSTRAQSDLLSVLIGPLK